MFFFLNVGSFPLPYEWEAFSGTTPSHKNFCWRTCMGDNVINHMLYADSLHECIVSLSSSGGIEFLEKL